MSKYNILTDKLNTYFSRNKIVSASAKPTNGTWDTGDIVISSSITSTVFGWICKQGGTPGTWMDLTSAEDITGEVSGHTHDTRYYKKAEVDSKVDSCFKKSGGTITGPTTVNSDMNLTQGFVIPDRNDGTRGFHLNTYKTRDGLNKTYAELVLKDPSGNGDWHWGKSLKLFDDGTVHCHRIETSGEIELPNNVSLYGRTTAGDRHYNLIGVDSNNNIYLGWGNETYINVKNTMTIEHDLKVQGSGSIYTRGLKIDGGGAYNSMSFGANGVRIEYARDAGQIYVAGSESNSSGFGTSFAAKYLESKEPYIIIGGSKIYAQGWDPGAVGAGSVWIKTT